MGKLADLHLQKAEAHAGNRSLFEKLKQQVLDQADGVLQQQPDLVYDPGSLTDKRKSAHTRCSPSFTQPGDAPCRKLAILMHGFTACPGLWYFLEAPLKNQGFCVLRPLLPGHGLAPKPATGWDKLVVRLDGNTVKLNDTWIKQTSEGAYIDLGLEVAKAEKSFIVTNVVHSKMVFAYNTNVGRRNIQNFDMVMPGDHISAKDIGTATFTQTQDRLYLHLPREKDARTYFQNAHLDLSIHRMKLQDDLSAMPTGDSWERYDDFAVLLARLGAAFKAEHPEGTLVIVGHSLGATSATDAVLHAPHSRVFDRILLFNPAFKTSKSYDWALVTLGQVLPPGIAKIDNKACARTRYTLSTGGYCTLGAHYARGVREFGLYAFCRFLEAAYSPSGSKPGLFSKIPARCGSILKRKGRTPGILPSGKIELVTTYLDEAIDNSMVDQLADSARELMGPDNVGFCYLKSDLSHSFFDELGSTSLKPFWWHDALTSRIVDYLAHDRFIPLEAALSYEKDAKRAGWTQPNLEAMQMHMPGAVIHTPDWGLKLLTSASQKLAHTDARCRLK